MITDTSLSGQVFVVTGGGSGIGRAAAIQIVIHGGSVAILDWNEDNANLVVQELRDHGGSAAAWKTDISKIDDVQDAVTAVLGHFGRIDGLVLAAGINGVWGPIDQMNPNRFAATVGVNLLGSFYMLNATVKHMREKGGSIVLVSSINGSRSYNGRGMSLYAATKAAQLSAAKSLAVELGPNQIRVNTVSPGGTKTNIGESTDWTGRWEDTGRPKKFPEGRIPLTGHEVADAADVGRAILFLLSPAAKHISGAEIHVDGGESLA